MLFYNFENLFDTQDDPTSLEDEFLPGGLRRWNDYRFYQKLKPLSKVILSSADFEPPEVIVLCEMENRFVLEKLLEATPLKGHAYAIVHKDSPDERGIRYESFYCELQTQDGSALSKSAITTFKCWLAFRLAQQLCVSHLVTKIVAFTLPSR